MTPTRQRRFIGIGYNDDAQLRSLSGERGTLAAAAGALGLAAGVPAASSARALNAFRSVLHTSSISSALCNTHTAALLRVEDNAARTEGVGV